MGWVSCPGHDQLFSGAAARHVEQRPLAAADRGVFGLGLALEHDVERHDALRGTQDDDALVLGALGSVHRLDLDGLVVSRPVALQEFHGDNRDPRLGRQTADRTCPA
jgi:hypothetical protein